MRRSALLTMETHDAFLLVSFGGPEGMPDVMPFLRNVTRKRNVPDDRLRKVAQHYELFGGVSPINQQNRDLIAVLKKEFIEHDIDLPIYWGNRNWHPMIEHAVKKMRDDGIKNALAFATSAYSSYSSCRQYLEDIERAREATGEHAPIIEKLRPFFNHPSFIAANESRLRDAIALLPENMRSDFHIAFSAHSIPSGMASECHYAAQLHATAKVLAGSVGCTDWKVVYQSRSGPPSQPWLEPDICDHIRDLKRQGYPGLVIAPIGFVSDHMEVLYDLDVEAWQLCQQLGMVVQRVQTAGTHPAYVRMIRELVEERVAEQHANANVDAGGVLQLLPWLCEPTCCPSGRPGAETAAAAAGAVKGV